jgi:hypothetical protein
MLAPATWQDAVVLDHVGNTLRLGHHLEERDWTLDGLRKRDREAAPSVKVCPSASPPHLAPRRYAPTAGMCLHHQSAGSCDRLRVSWWRSIERHAGGYKKGDIVNDTRLLEKL